MGKYINLTGRRFGKMLVVKDAGRNKYGHTLFLCKCDCGNEKVVRSATLLIGKGKSCGCIPHGGHNKLTYGEASFNTVLFSYRWNAKQRKRDFSLTPEEFKEIIVKDCIYCGQEASTIRSSPDNFGEFVFSGLDRVDNDKGYSVDNVVPCCNTCNLAKRDMSVQEFSDWIDRLITHRLKDKTTNNA
jgi:hypothetical protein